MNTQLSEAIEAEYDAYCLDREKDLNGMYAMLSDYVKGIIAMTIKDGAYVDTAVVEEISQDVLLVIATDKIHTFEKREARFTTFCSVIAKNKALNYVKKRNRNRVKSLDELEEDGSIFPTQGIYENPERELVKQEQNLRRILVVKDYLQLLMNQKGKPYKTVSCCYTMVLFHKYYPAARELTSPGWAFGELQEETVENGAERFIEEMNQWFPRFNLYWGDAFLDGMDEKEEDIYISDLIFGEHFRVKDFENWSLRMRKKIQEELLVQACEVLE